MDEQHSMHSQQSTWSIHGGLSRLPEDDGALDPEEVLRGRGSIALTPRQAELDPESCDLLGLALEDRLIPVEISGDALATLLASGQSVEILSFGTFKLSLSRPARAQGFGPWSFVEAPYAGPVEFVPAPPLIRQLESGNLDAGQVPRCDGLYSALRDHPRLPRGKVPMVIKLVLRALVEVLLAHRSVTIPHVGQLVLQRLPTQLRIGRSSEVVPGPVRLTVMLHPLSSLVARIPGVIDPPQIPALQARPTLFQRLERPDEAPISAVPSEGLPELAEFPLDAPGEAEEADLTGTAIDSRPDEPLPATRPLTEDVEDELLP